MKLPIALTKWVELLSLLPEDLALPVGRMIQKLAPFIGPVRQKSVIGEIEPEGYAGLTNRGSYERLLPTEWALVKEMPEEFERRAVMNEQLFYRQEKVEDKGEKRSVLLLDAGPLQLGSPRIAQIALLILFERRARDASSAFNWGVLQDPENVYTSLDATHLLKFISARSLKVVDAAHENDWIFLLEALDPVDDLWVVSVDQAILSGFDKNSVQIFDSMEVNTSGLMIKIGYKNRMRKMYLELPTPQVCSRLIRNPLKTDPANISDLVTGDFHKQNLLFSPTGTKLFVVTASKMVKVLNIVDNWTTGTSHPVDMLTEDLQEEKILGVQTLKRRRMSITVKDGLMRFNKVSVVHGSLELCKFDEIQLESEYGVVPRLFYYSVVEGYPHSVFFIDDARNLINIYFAGGNGYCVRIIAENVLQLVQLSGSLVYIAYAENGQLVVATDVNASVREYKYYDIGFDKDSQLTIGSRTGEFFNWSRATVDYFSVLNAGDWHIFHKDKKYTLPVDNSVNVIGLAGHIPKTSDGQLALPSLIQVASDRRSIMLCDGRSEQLMLSTETDIVDISYDYYCSRIAIATAADELIVYSLHKRTEQLHMSLPQ